MPHSLQPCAGRMMWDDGSDDDGSGRKRPAAASTAHAAAASKRPATACVATAAPKRRKMMAVRMRPAAVSSALAHARRASSPRASRVPGALECLAGGIVTVGSDCAGLVTEGLALEILGVPHKHVFISEVNPHVRHLIYNLYGKQMHVYKDCGARDLDTVPRAHLYVFGFPCQSFSPAGKGKGLADPRGAVLTHCLDYVRRKRPLVVVAENSARLASSKFEDVRAMIITQLEECGYRVHYTVMNTKEQGLPQNRPRFYMVAFLSPKHGFKFPTPIDPVPLASLLEAPSTPNEMDKRRRAKARERTHAHLQVARNKLQAKGFRPEDCDTVVDIGGSPEWGHMMIGCSPCLTSQRCSAVGGHYLMRFNRTMTEKEVCRLQGIPDGRVDYVAAGVKKSKFLHAVGNAMSSNVLARVLACALTAAGLAEGVTPPTADDILKYLVRGR